ncbi:hypothetical protein I4U23_027982 [Adineta vaga]|nr:hypothetical protein I4U23_027982 [Adineta vaga]
MSSAPRSWPHLVGKSTEEAIEAIKRDTGFSKIQVVGPGMMVTMDYRTDRVRIHADKHGRVASTPTVG